MSRRALRRRESVVAPGEVLSRNRPALGSQTSAQAGARGSWLAAAPQAERIVPARAWRARFAAGARLARVGPAATPRERKLTLPDAGEDRWAARACSRVVRVAEVGERSLDLVKPVRLTSLTRRGPCRWPGISARGSRGMSQGIRPGSRVTRRARAGGAVGSSCCRPPANGPRRIAHRGKASRIAEASLYVSRRVM